MRVKKIISKDFIKKNIFLKLFFFIFLSSLFFICAHEAEAFLFSKTKKSLSSRYKGYNVILIIVDALRPDYLGCYGYSKKVSPNIDMLAKKGIIFENAFCQIPLTMPSVTSIFTSLYPFSHGTIHVFKDSVPEGVYTMAEIFSIYGYNTAWFVALRATLTQAVQRAL